MSQAKGDSRAGWRRAVTGNVLMMGLVSFFTDASSEMIYPLLPVFLGGLAPAAATFWLGLTEGLAETTASILKLFSGRLSDAVGKRKLLVVLGYGASTIFRPLMAVCLAAWHVAGFRFADRIGKGVRTSPRDALIGESVGPEHRGIAFSFHRAMDHAGAILGPILAVVILYLLLGEVVWRGHGEATTPEHMRGLRWTFAAALVPGLLAMLVLVWKVREIAPPARPPEDRPGPRLNAYRRLPVRFYLYVAIVMLFALGNSSDLFILAYAQRTVGFGVAEVLMLWVLLHVAKMVASVPGGAMSDRLGRRPVIVAGWAVYAVVYLAFGWFAGGAWLWGLVVLYGLYYGLTEGAEKALVTDFVPRENYGTAFGVYHSAVGIAALPANILFGILWYRLDRVTAGLGPKVAFTAGACLAGLAAVLLVILLAATRAPRTQR